jgi:hypothetical protein
LVKAKALRPGRITLWTWVAADLAIRVTGGIDSPSMYSRTTSASGASLTGTSSTVGIADPLENLLLDLGELAAKLDLLQSYHRALGQAAQQILAP